LVHPLAESEQQWLARRLADSALPSEIRLLDLELWLELELDPSLDRSYPHRLDLCWELRLDLGLDLWSDLLMAPLAST